MKQYAKSLSITILSLTITFGFACSGGSSGSVMNLKGSGASFPKPIYEKWVNEYEKIDPKVRIDYQSKGSGGGQKDILAKLVDFGASDDPMKDEDLKKADGQLLHIPTVLGAVVMTYNIKGVDKPLKLGPETIASIYMGEIKKWNDEKIRAENPDINLPDADILPVYRADSSGTTAVFTDFLSKTVPSFKEKVGASKQPNWIKGVGTGAPRNDGVMGQVKQTPNTIGYVEIAFAKANKLPTALIKNKAGKYIEASVETVTNAAAGSASNMPDDLRIKIANADGESSYPIASFTYILAYKEQKDAAKGKALVQFLWWAVHDGKQFAEDLYYAPLPDTVVTKVEAKLNSITFGGKPIR